MNSFDNDDSLHQPIKAVPFEYPNEETSTVVQDDNIRRLLDFITYYVLTCKDPRTTLIALCYSSGYDVGQLYHCNNTVRSIATANGMSHYKLHQAIQQIGRDLQLTPRINNVNRITTVISSSIQSLHQTHSSSVEVI